MIISRVDTGYMVTLDMGLALETVSHLKRAVETTCGIPLEKQVLLISGDLAFPSYFNVAPIDLGSIFYF